MHRRNIITATLAAAGALLAAASRTAHGAPQTDGRAKVVYHLSDLEKVGFVLANIRNHFDGVGGPDHVTIALVVHGPALKAFHATGASPEVAHRTEQFAKAGVALSACGNTMRAQNVTLAQLLPGFAAADRGGVVRIAELQAQGYVYLRP
jgi:uncharacterized protein